MRTPTRLHERLYDITRQDEFRGHSDSNEPPAFQATTILPTSTCKHSRCYTQENFSVSRSSRLIALVDVATKEWTNIENESSHLPDHDRRLPVGLGRSDGSTGHTRQVDGHRQIESHQLPGIEDCFVCSTAMKNQLKNQTVLLQLDNTTAVAYLLKEGGTQSRSLHYRAAEILISADQQNISVRPSYLPGQMNTQADALSRSKEPDEWMLAPAVARKIFMIYSLPVVDLFASQISKQLNQYFSTDRRDPHSLGTDALHHDWNFQSKLLYASPPPPNLWASSPYQVSDDSDNALVAEGAMAPRVDRIIGPIAEPFAGIAGHDIEFDNQHGIERQVEHDGMAHLSASLRDGGVEPEVAGFIQNAWKPSTKVQYAAVW